MTAAVLEKILLTIIGLITSGIIGIAVQKYRKYKKLTKKEEDEIVKNTIINVLDEKLEPVCENIDVLKEEIENIQTDINDLQNVDVNFSTRFSPLQEEIEHLKDDITEILEEQERQGITIDNIAEKEEQLRKKLRCEWRYRIRAICLIYIKRGYMTQEEFEQLQEFYALYEAIGGNGQTKELYEKTIKLPIRAE